MPESIGAFRQPRRRRRRAAARPRLAAADRAARRQAHACARATRSSPADAAASRTSMSSAPILRPDPEPARARRGCSARAICCRRRSCRAARVGDQLLPTPMAIRRTSCRSPRWSTIREGREIGALPLGRLPRDHATALRPGRSRRARSAAGRLRPCRAGLRFRRRRRAATAGCTRCSAIATAASGHAAETSFGAHVFNTMLIYRGEPQSYCRPPPGLSTRLFLRLGDGGYDTLCQLIYPASRPWRPAQRDRDHPPRPRRARDRPRRLAIPCSGLAAVALSRRCSTPRRARRAGDRRLCDHPRHDLPAVRLSRALGPRRRLQPRPHVRFLTGIRRRVRPVAARKKCYIVLSNSCSSRRAARRCRSSTTARS